MKERYQIATVPRHSDGKLAGAVSHNTHAMQDDIVAVDVLI